MILEFWWLSAIFFCSTYSLNQPGAGLVFLGEKVFQPFVIKRGGRPKGTAARIFNSAPVNFVSFRHLVDIHIFFGVGAIGIEGKKVHLLRSSQLLGDAVGKMRPLRKSATPPASMMVVVSLPGSFRL